MVPLAVQDRPAGFEHVDALGVLLLDLAVVVAFIEQPEEFEVDGVEEAFGDAVFAGGVGVEDDFAGLEAGEMDVQHLAEDGDGVGGDSSADDEVESTGFAGGCGLEDVVGDFGAVDGVAAEAGGEGEVDSSEDYAGQFGSLLRLVGEGFEVAGRRRWSRG